MKKNLFLGALLFLSSQLFSNTIINYIPNYTENGFLDVNQLNSAIRLSEVQYDTANVDLIIPDGVYYLPNNKTINLQSHVFLVCKSVTFIYKWVTDEYSLNIIEINNIKNAGISGLNIDFSQAYKDSKPTYENADKFVNRSIIQIEHSDSIFIKKVTINKIIGVGIELSNSKWCQITDCNISGSWCLGNENGTMGYSINIVGTMSMYNVIYGNKLSNSRHQIVLQYGCAYNMIANNEMRDTKSLKKLWFIEVIDREYTFNLTLHGSNPHHNVILNNYADHRISVDNVKKTGNGPGNEILDNTINGLLDVQSVAPYWNYNEGQILKGNKYKKLRIEAKNCTIENNTKIK